MSEDPQGRSLAEVARDRKCGDLIRRLWLLEQRRAAGEAAARGRPLTPAERYAITCQLHDARAVVYRNWGADALV
jgi:hypothetical protein